MTNQIPCRKELLNWINIVSFVMDDAKLFLDTHPCNQEAIDYYEEYKKQRHQALREYAKYYGPLTLDTICSPAKRWQWVNEPWPWQEGGC